MRCNYATTVGYKIDLLLSDPERLAAMAANARRIGRPDAGSDVARTSLQMLTPPLWISREAQKSMLLASQEDRSRRPAPERQLQVLTDPITGDRGPCSPGAAAAMGVTTWSKQVKLARKTLRTMRWQPDNLDLAIAGKWLLGDDKVRTFGLA